MNLILKCFLILTSVLVYQSYGKSEIVTLNGIIVISYNLVENSTAVCVQSVRYVENKKKSYLLDGMIVDNTNYYKPSINYKIKRGSLEKSIHCQDNLPNRYYFSGGDKYREFGSDSLTFKVIFNIKGKALLVNNDHVEINESINSDEEEDFDYFGCPPNYITDKYLILLEGFNTSSLKKIQIDSMRLQRVYYDKLIRFGMS